MYKQDLLSIVVGCGNIWNAVRNICSVQSTKVE